MSTIDQALNRTGLVFADAPAASKEARDRNEWRRAHLHVLLRLAREADAQLGTGAIDLDRFAIALAKVLPLTEHAIYEIDELLRVLEAKAPGRAPDEQVARAEYLASIQPALLAHKAKYPERVGGPRERFVRDFFPGAAPPVPRLR